MAALVDEVVSDRLLPTLGLVGQEWKLLVRCISRYQVGSGAPPHTDPGAFTVVVLLDDSSRHAFVGGGTVFWADEVVDAEMLSEQPDAEHLIHRPGAGTGMISDSWPTVLKK